MVALGLVTTEHLEGKMACVVSHFRFGVIFFLSAAPQLKEMGGLVLRRAIKDQVECCLCTVVLFSLKLMGVCVLLCLPSHHTGVTTGSAASSSMPGITWCWGSLCQRGLLKAITCQGR